MKKLILIMICALASFAFASSSSLVKANETKGACDGHGGTVSYTLYIDCGGDGIDYVFSGKTCKDQYDALAETYGSLCIGNM